MIVTRSKCGFYAICAHNATPGPEPSVPDNSRRRRSQRTLDINIMDHVIIIPTKCLWITEMQKAADAADISVLFFSAGANFWANLGNFGSFLGYFG